MGVGRLSRNRCEKELDGGEIARMRGYLLDGLGVRRTL
jgi:hypothetical protein